MTDLVIQTVGTATQVAVSFQLIITHMNRPTIDCGCDCELEFRAQESYQAVLTAQDSERIIQDKLTRAYQVRAMIERASQQLESD